MANTLLIGAACELERHATVAVKDKNVLNPVYSDAILRAGGIPVLIPTGGTTAQYEQVYERLDGILLPGADDVSPALYGEEPHPSVKLIPDVQYDTWRALIELCLGRPKPLLCVCGGMQVLNVALGGSLIQDIPSQMHSPVCHHSGTQPDAVHEIEIERGSRLGGILACKRAAVNSAHHQAIARVADGLAVTARCPEDGVIEAVEMPDHPFLVAVQWHPERIFEGETSRRLFTTFVEECLSDR